LLALPLTKRGDIAVLQRRRCVEPPDLAVAEIDLSNEASDLRDRLGHSPELRRQSLSLG
jgi:hypothetical protein